MQGKFQSWELAIVKANQASRPLECRLSERRSEVLRLVVNRSSDKVGGFIREDRIWI